MHRFILAFLISLFSLTALGQTPYYIKLSTDGVNSKYISLISLNSNDFTSVTTTQIGYDVAAQIRSWTVTNSASLVWSNLGHGVFAAEVGGGVTGTLATVASLWGTNNLIRVDTASSALTLSNYLNGIISGVSLAKLDAAWTNGQKFVLQPELWSTNSALVSAIGLKLNISDFSTYSNFVAGNPYHYITTTNTFGAIGTGLTVSNTSSGILYVLNANDLTNNWVFGTPNALTNNSVRINGTLLTNGVTLNIVSGDGLTTGNVQGIIISYGYATAGTVVSTSNTLAQATTTAQNTANTANGIAVTASNLAAGKTTLGIVSNNFLVISTPIINSNATVAIINGTNDALVAMIGLTPTNIATLSPAGNASPFLTYASTSTNLNLTTAQFVVFTAGTITVTLPSAAANPGLSYRIKKSDAGTTLTVAAIAGLIDGNVNLQIAGQYTSIDLVSDGMNWNVF